jgi:DNA-binding response OmpR family regulator
MFARGNGLDLIQHVRKSCSAMQTPIVMVSASMDPCLKQDAIKTGANFCMGKPPNFKLLTSTVSQLLTAPFVDATDQDSVYYTAIHWTLDGQFFYFCPELQLLVHAEAEDQAVAQLENLIQGEFTKGRAIKRISPPSVNRSLLKAQNS